MWLLDGGMWNLDIIVRAPPFSAKLIPRRKVEMFSNTEPMRVGNFEVDPTW
jgi:hypothetical protein